MAMSSAFSSVATAALACASSSDTSTRKSTLVSGVILILAPSSFRAALGDRFVDLLDAEPTSVRLVPQKPVQVPNRSSRRFGREFRASIREKVEADFVAGVNAEMLEHLSSEGDLPPGGDGQGCHIDPRDDDSKALLHYSQWVRRRRIGSTDASSEISPPAGARNSCR